MINIQKVVKVDMHTRIGEKFGYLGSQFAKKCLYRNQAGFPPTDVGAQTHFHSTIAK